MVAAGSEEYEYAIVGGGIAGLAIAEVFARSGHSVVLIEKNERLCQEASAAHHGWFHFGSLYSIFPQNQFLRTMVGGVEDLLDYYARFPGMNIKVGNDGKLAFPPSDAQWFRDEPIEYIVCARNDPDFHMRRFDGVKDYAKKAFFLLTWELALKQFVSRHQRFHKHDWRGPEMASQWIPRAGIGDYSRDVITKPHHPGVNLDCDTHFRVVGFDRPMRPLAIVSDLVRGLIGSGGQIRTNAEVERLEKTAGGTTLHLKDGSTIRARKVIAASGKWLGRFLKRPADAKVVASPLLVAYPAVTGLNFVRMTPFVERSVNHIHHAVDGRTYSVVGGGYSADPNDAAAMARASSKLEDMARAVFPSLAEAQVVESYQGYKTEVIAASGERNYDYFIREIDKGVYAVVPGKFSLAFSLAVNTYMRLTGGLPGKDVKLATVEQAAPFVGRSYHGELVLNALARRDTSGIV